MYEQGIGNVCQGDTFETSLKRAEQLRKPGVIKIMERIPEPDKLPEIIKLREQGLTYQAIGEKLGISLALPRQSLSMSLYECEKSS